MPQPPVNPQPQRPSVPQEPQFVPTVQEQTITGISFDCSNKPTGPNKDNQYCDIYHACVFGQQQKTYGCAQNGERFYYDETTQKCEFTSKNPSGCPSGNYFTPLTQTNNQGNQQQPTNNNGYGNNNFNQNYNNQQTNFIPQTTRPAFFTQPSIQYGNQNNFENNNNFQPSGQNEQVEPWKQYVRDNEQFSCDSQQDGFYPSKWCNVYYRCFNKNKFEFLCAKMQSGDRLWWKYHSTSQSVPQPQAQCEWPCDTGRQCTSPGGILLEDGSVSESTSEAQRILDKCPKPSGGNQQNGGYGQGSNGGNNNNNFGSYGQGSNGGNNNNNFGSYGQGSNGGNNNFGSYGQGSNGGNNNNNFGSYGQGSNGGNNNFGSYGQGSNGGNNNNNFGSYGQGSNGGNNNNNFGGYGQGSNGGNNNNNFGSYGQGSNGGNNNFGSYGQGSNGGNIGGGNGQVVEDNTDDLFRIPDSENPCQGVSDGSFVSNPKYCNIFHVCVKGVRKDFVCAKGSSTYDLWWNDATKQCEWPCKIQCSKQIFGSSSSAAEIASMDRNLNPALCGADQNSNGNNGNQFGAYGNQFTQPAIQTMPPQTLPPQTQRPQTQPPQTYPSYNNNNNNYGGYGF